ncbi:hypothetical protein HPP92_011078 [Vanilla planifolia]|uniref:Uncharacterized protein n=1 Tax=Vanilla planifolia TaxID=51239 RepID=A0A835V1F8_VANPL|nr:hypothetical protein HPP92_011078 [Vanilla planifolia]
MRRRSPQSVEDMVEMEMCVYYTSNTEYMKKWTNLMERGLVDVLALHVHAVNNLVESELDAEIMNEVVGERVGGGSTGIEKMLEEP